MDLPRELGLVVLAVRVTFPLLLDRGDEGVVGWCGFVDGGVVVVESFVGLLEE